LEEYGDEAYFRSFLGDEWMYHGRGYLMNTWRDAYNQLSLMLGVDLVNEPDRLIREKDLAAQAAVWFWNKNNLNLYANQANFVSVCSLINRGEAIPTGPINGWEERLAFYERAKRVLGFGTELLMDATEEEKIAVAYKEIDVEITAGGWAIRKGTAKDPEYLRAKDVLDTGLFKIDGDGWVYAPPKVVTYAQPSPTPGDTIKEGTNSYAAIRYLEPLIGQMPYWVWESGPVPDGEGAYAVNGPPPPVEELRGKRIFCAGVPNICRRIAGKVIPNRGNELYDGGVAAYFDSPTINEETGTRGFWASYGLEEPFDLATAKQWAYNTRSMVLIGREYTGGESADLASQGHVALLLPSGYVLQSFQSDASGWPGLNWDYTIEESHDGGYYTKMVAPWNWLEF
jgi:hypothetical protein